MDDLRFAHLKLHLLLLQPFEQLLVFLRARLPAVKRLLQLFNPVFSIVEQVSHAADAFFPFVNLLLLFGQLSLRLGQSARPIMQGCLAGCKLLLILIQFAFECS